MLGCAFLVNLVGGLLLLLIFPPLGVIMLILAGLCLLPLIFG